MNKRGQIVVEYVLLLVIATGVAALLVSQLVSRNTDKPGVLTAQWQLILNAVGSDVPDSNKK
ncbi:hypothetical protein ACLSU7_06410 [Bdellovibrio sp. HCB185ZH]|uniref:hypothetical protein n=1 Tax=Bdellovibrio sp. HCB185ZH TaxID=3394235 RepID=UPI0039A43F64